MDLNERKIRILEAIIKDYIETGEPIGSRTIAKKYNLGVSPATIRNEMSDLEELGLIIQPHTSSGRVPSDKGYRLYVDEFMEQRALTEEEISILKNVIKNNINHMDYLMQQTAKALAMLTNYTTVVSKPITEEINIKHIQLMPLDEKSIIAVLVTENKDIKNIVINVNKEFEQEKLSAISNSISNILKNYSLEEIKQQIFLNKKFLENEKNLNSQNIFSEEEQIISLVFEEIFKSFQKDEEIKLYTSGVNNILDFPEFSDIEKAKSIFQTFEEKEILVNIFENNNKEANSIQILIGNENCIEPLKDCSIVKTEYKIANTIGKIGIIAPTRMDYAKAVSILNEIIKNINDVLKGASYWI